MGSDAEGRVKYWAERAELEERRALELAQKGDFVGAMKAANAAKAAATEAHAAWLSVNASTTVRRSNKAGDNSLTASWLASGRALAAANRARRAAYARGGPKPVKAAVRERIHNVAFARGMRAAAMGQHPNNEPQWDTVDNRFVGENPKALEVYTDGWNRGYYEGLKMRRGERNDDDAIRAMTSEDQES